VLAVVAGGGSGPGVADPRAGQGGEAWCDLASRGVSCWCRSAPNRAPFNRARPAREHEHRPSFSLLTQAQARFASIAVSQEVEPWLAEGWTRSDDGLRYTIKLRANVLYSDGHPFTADDVRGSRFEAVYGPGRTGPARWPTR